MAAGIRTLRVCPHSICHFVEFDPRDGSHRRFNLLFCCSPPLRWACMWEDYSEEGNLARGLFWRELNCCHYTTTWHRHLMDWRGRELGESVGVKERKAWLGVFAIGLSTNDDSVREICPTTVSYRRHCLEPPIAHRKDLSLLSPVKENWIVACSLKRCWSGMVSPRSWDRSCCIFWTRSCCVQCSNPFDVYRVRSSQLVSCFIFVCWRSLHFCWKSA